jgi:hypothetical protein
MSPMTPRDALALLTQDGDVVDIVDTPVGDAIFLTRGVAQVVITVHPGIDGACVTTLHQHSTTDDAAKCHQGMVADLTATVEAFNREHPLMARSQAAPVGMYL